jgi:hypothetical protein
MIVFGLKALDWNTAQNMTFTAMELCAMDAIEFSERAHKTSNSGRARKG